MKKLNSDQKLLKLIDQQIQFADVVFKDSRNKRFGLEACTPKDLNKVLIDQYICSWQYNKTAYTGNPATTYTSTTWRRRMDPPNKWITYGEFEGNDPCTGVCGREYTCEDYPENFYSTLAIRISADLVGSQYLPNASGSAVLYAQVSDGTYSPVTQELNWRCVGSMPLNDTNMGELWMPVFGDNPFTDAVDGAMASESIRFILRDGCKVYQIIFPDSEWTIDAQGYNAFPPESDDAFWNCSNESYLQNNVWWDTCDVYTITQPPTIKTVCNACYGGPDADCVYCGTELVITQIGHSQTQEVVCIDDQECIHINVKDQCGNPIEDYDIYIDNKYIGQTDERGKISTTILHASTNWNHILNFCYCFTTTGLCNQQKIDMVVHVEGVECEDCKPVQKCEDAVKPLSEPIIIEDEIIDPWNPDGPTTHHILCFTCDEENPAFVVGTYIEVPVSITDCADVPPIGYWVNSIGDCIPEDVCGCTDPEAENYNPDANIPCDGFNCFKCETSGIPNCCCFYPEPDLICGCLDPEATNENPLANADCDCTPIDQLGGSPGAINCCTYAQGPSPGYIIKTANKYPIYRNAATSWVTQEYAEGFGGTGSDAPGWLILPIYISDFYYTEWNTNGWFNPEQGNAGCQYNPTGSGEDPQMLLGMIGKWMYDIKIEYDPRYVQPGTLETAGIPPPGEGGLWGEAWSSDQLSIVNLTDFAENGLTSGQQLELNIDSNITQEPGGFGVWNSNNRSIWIYTVDTMNLSSIRVRFPASIPWGNFQDSMERPILYIPFRVMSDNDPGGAEIVQALAAGGDFDLTFKFGVTWVPEELEGEFAVGSHMWDTKTLKDPTDCNGPSDIWGAQQGVLDYPIFDYTSWEYTIEAGNDTNEILNFGAVITQGYGWNEVTGVNTEGIATITVGN